MDKIYCITKGEYDCWDIKYSFKSKEKRDNILELLDKSYRAYEITLNDSIEATIYYYALINENNVEFLKDVSLSDTYEDNIIKHDLMSFMGISELRLPITK